MEGSGAEQTDGWRIGTAGGRGFEGPGCRTWMSECFFLLFLKLAVLIYSQPQQLSEECVRHRYSFRDLRITFYFRQLCHDASINLPKKNRVAPDKTVPHTCCQCVKDDLFTVKKYTPTCPPSYAIVLCVFQVTGYQAVFSFY